MEVDNVETQPKELRRADELWFEDGNLVIQAGNSQYRVYRGILAMRSPVFKDMLSFPQPPGAELVENCPLVHLPDPEVEVTPFLRAIFDSPSFMPHPAPTTYDVVVGVLRLSHKYEVDCLRRRALIHLSSAYRTTLPESDNSIYYGNQMDPSCPASDIRSFEWPDNWTHDIVTIQLAREVDAPWILPWAFYCLGIVYYREPDNDVFHGASSNGVSVALSLQDRKSIARGHKLQSISSAVDILRFLTDPIEIEGCTSPKSCYLKRLRAIDGNRENLRVYASIPLALWSKDDWKLLEGLCPICLVVLKRTHRSARHAFWDKLPEMYGLPQWEELERLKTAAIGTDLFC
ncbi:BTB domain-containing protein [Mycena venus]|uniref:BTB domain-containing protein n=1 Tax=Mycena venus TaxID=2733690 RepID=A0A8H7CX91_9AGAR|nr:BTB domain-containing protein [Mycena venus]